jgi:formylglycine-generating enzyme required for sulfatase activity
MRDWIAAVAAACAVVLSSALAAEPGEVFRHCAACPEMVVVPAGSFVMGSPADEAGRSAMEDPRHRARIHKPLAIARYEVSFAEWDACVADAGCDGYRPDDGGLGRGERPVVNVSWNDAYSYIAWLSVKTGSRYRLLSETEWEYAARGGTTSERYWDGAACAHANIADACDSGQTGSAPVGSHAANPFGLHDMIGNVSEWVQDCWFTGYEGLSADGLPRSQSRGGNPIEPTAHLSHGDCTMRGHRGGAWNSPPDAARSASRAGEERSLRSPVIGIRVATAAP